jgi:chemotaxis protein methyltransferase CheR
MADAEFLSDLTRFFRNQAHFDALEHYVIPELMKIKKAAGNTAIKIRSAGCSTGEEPYSIAMLLSEILPPPWQFEIAAGDISPRSLATAKEGFYADSRIAGIKSKIRFDHQDLKNDSALQNMDIVFCRNVLIYFDEEARAALVNRLWNSMAAKSFLFIGNSETLFGMDTGFEFIKTKWAALYRKFI